MRFEVPQFIEVEDKIVGPFTWKQFIYLAGGAGALVILFLFLPFILFLLLAGPIAALAAGLAFYQVNNRPFSVILESAIRYFSRTRLYLWRKTEGRPVGSSPGEAPAYTPPSSGSKIASLSRNLEINALERKR